MTDICFNASLWSDHSGSGRYRDKQSHAQVSQFAVGCLTSRPTDHMVCYVRNKRFAFPTMVILIWKETIWQRPRLTHGGYRVSDILLLFIPGPWWWINIYFQSLHRHLWHICLDQVYRSGNLASPSPWTLTCELICSMPFSLRSHCLFRSRMQLSPLNVTPPRWGPHWVVYSALCGAGLVFGIQGVSVQWMNVYNQLKESGAVLVFHWGIKSQLTGVCS